jgi:hypothetical protein
LTKRLKGVDKYPLPIAPLGGSDLQLK